MNTLADTIIEALRGAKTAGEIEQIASTHRAEVMAMQASDPARYHHVLNAKRYYMTRIRNAGTHNQD
jgi:hypothetical protein